MRKTRFSALLLPLLIAAAGCTAPPSLKLPAECPQTVGLNSLTLFDVGENTLHLTDFILDPATIDSVSSSTSEMMCQLGSDKRTATITVKEGMLPFANLQIWIGGVPVSVPVRKSDKIDYTFRFNPEGKSYKRVQIAGQMNNWVASMTPDLQMGADSIYSVKLRLSPGTYLYQLALDGEQAHDPTNPDKVDNGFGKFNSILQVAGHEEQYPQLQTKKFDAKTITLTYSNEVTDIFVYWNNYRLSPKFVTVSGKNITIAIPKEAAATERSFIRVWVTNKLGISNDILIPLAGNAIVTDATTLSRHDKHANIIYFLLVDRFLNGDKSNDRPLDRPDVKPQADFMGGDLAGIRQTIDNGYFEKLGINTLWVSPLAQNPYDPYGYNAVGKTKFSGYHGYWPISSSKVDNRFGTNQELKELVADAHTHDINVLLDYVANHVHKDHPLYQTHPEWVTPLWLPDGRMNVELWDEQRLTTWFDTFLPTLDFSRPEVVDLMIDSAMFWMTEFKLDGFRQDACKHIQDDFWRALTLRLKQNDPKGNFYQVGESYGSPELIASYINSGMLDGQFDFNVYDEATSAFNGVSGGTLTRLNNVLKSGFKSYGTHNLMGIISGNHDKPRFMALASGDLKPGEDAKAAAWTRNIEVTDSTTAYNKLALLHTFNLTIPGVPVIFYGDEIGLTGANDPDCRRMMRFDDLTTREQKLFDKVSLLTHLRRSDMALLYGDFLSLENTADTWVYARKYFDNEAIVVINNSDREETFVVALPSSLVKTKFEALFGTSYKVESRNLTMTLAPYSSEVLH